MFDTMVGKGMWRQPLAPRIPLGPNLRETVRLAASQRLSPPGSEIARAEQSKALQRPRDSHKRLPPRETDDPQRDWESSNTIGTPAGMWVAA